MRRSSLKCLAVFVLFLALACGQARAGKVEDRDAIAEAFIHWRYGNVLHLAGRYEEAAEQFGQSIAAYPTAEGHTFLGWSLSELGQLEDAIAECEKAISLDSDYGNPYNDIGVYLIELGRPEEAVPWLQKAITAKRIAATSFLIPIWVEFFYRRGRLGKRSAPSSEPCPTIRNMCPPLQD